MTVSEGHCYKVICKIVSLLMVYDSIVINRHNIDKNSVLCIGDIIVKFHWNWHLEILNAVHPLLSQCIIFYWNAFVLHSHPYDAKLIFNCGSKHYYLVTCRVHALSTSWISFLYYHIIYNNKIVIKVTCKK